MPLSMLKISISGAYRTKPYAALIQTMRQGRSYHRNLHFESIGSD